MNVAVLGTGMVGRGNCLQTRCAGASRAPGFARQQPERAPVGEHCRARGGISVGLIRTAEVEQWFFAEPKARGWTAGWADIEANILKHYLSIPVGRVGSPNDIARMAVFLASPQASYINGASLRVDGGSDA